MSGPSNYNPQNPVLKWVERRLPIGGLIHSSFVAYPTPRNLYYWWTFGAILAVCLWPIMVGYRRASTSR